MTEVDLTGSHPCPVPGCRCSAEEHHRVNVGLVMENAELRKQARGDAPPADLAAAVSEAIPVLSGLVGVFVAAKDAASRQAFDPAGEPAPALRKGHERPTTYEPR